MSAGRKRTMARAMNMESQMVSLKSKEELKRMEVESRRRMEEEEEEDKSTPPPDPDALMSMHELRTLYKVVCHLERWPAGTMSLTELKELKELVKTRLAAMGEGNHPDGDVNAIEG